MLGVCNIVTLILQSAYILHHYPYQNNSVLLKLFTEQDGLMSAIAKGAKRPRSSWYGLVRPFVSLQLAYGGRGQVKSIKQMEATQSLIHLEQLAMLAGFYINELLLYFLRPDDPHSALFADYQHCLISLHAEPGSIELALRRFEWRLLNELGYAPSLRQDASGRAIVDGQCYRVVPGSLPVAISSAEIDDSNQCHYPGGILLAIASGQLQDGAVMRYAKYLLRQWLDFYLEGKVLKSRKLLRSFMSQTRQKEVIN